MYSRRKFNSLMCMPPEPYASMVDILTASQYMEYAIHDKTTATTIDHLNQVVEWLTHARDYFAKIDAQNMVMRLNKTIKYIEEKFIAEVKTPNVDLTKIKGKMYKFMGVLGKLYLDTKY
jgi:hypothetical protein